MMITNKQWFPMVSKWCRILSIHSLPSLFSVPALPGAGWHPPPSETNPAIFGDVFASDFACGSAVYDFLPAPSLLQLSVKNGGLLLVACFLVRGGAWAVRLIAMPASLVSVYGEELLWTDQAGLFPNVSCQA